MTLGHHDQGFPKGQDVLTIRLEAVCDEFSVRIDPYTFITGMCGESNEQCELPD
jgi:hypothetical protein